MKKVEKGKPGYLDYAHRSKLTFILVFVVIIVVLLSVSSLFSETVSGLVKILAVLNVLPASNIVVQYIAMFPYHSREASVYEELSREAGDCLLITELAITNPNGPTVSLPYAAIAGDRVVALYERKGKKDTLAKLPEPDKLASYLEGRLRLSNVDLPVGIVTDEAQFRKRLSTLRPAAGEKEQEQTRRAASALLANSF